MATIHGKTNFQRHDILEIPIGSGTITARLKVPGLGFGETLLEKYPAPIPPRRVLRDGRGVVFNPKTGEPVRVEERSPEFDAAHRAHELRFAVLGFVELLDDTAWKFDTPHPGDAGSWPEYADALYNELVEMGFPVSAMRAIGAKIAELTGVTEKEVEEIAAGF